MVGTALTFDDVDDRIVLSPESYQSTLVANQDFTIGFWWKTNSFSAEVRYFLSNRLETESSVFAYTNGGSLILACRFVAEGILWASQQWADGADGVWHSYALTRKGAVLSFYRDGMLAKTDNRTVNSLSLATSLALTIGSRPDGGEASPGWADDFRVYNRVLTAEEVAALAGAM